MALCIYETALIAHAKSDMLLQSYTFIADSGASILKVLSKVTYHGHTIDDNGDKVNIKLQDVQYVPELTVNLFSVTKAISQPVVFFVGSDQAC
jgi:hypothetical protein